MTSAGLSFQVHSLGNRVFPASSPIVATIGNFDGVHLGHRAILERTIERAHASALPSVAMTFSPHPTKFFKPKQAKEELTTLSEKIQLLLESGIDYVVVVEFNPWLAGLSAREFCAQVLEERFCIAELVVGYDFHFGKNREGQFEFLKDYFSAKGKHVEQLGAVHLPHDGVVSSSRIRELIKQGKVRAAAEHLGRYFSLGGRIVPGDAKARELGFPTANLRWENELTPKTGIYACWVEFRKDGLNGQLLPGVLSCGHRPIMGQDLHLQIEAHVFDFSQNVYNCASRFYFVEFLRDELPFTDWDTLTAQIKIDCEQARKILVTEKIALQSL